MSAPATISTPRHWVKEITPARGLLDVPWRELWAYRDLVALLALRDISASYKQTVLGPLWFVLQPILTTVVFSFLFGRMAKLGTDGMPHFLFYMSGLLPWVFFADCVNKTALTFSKNAQVFGKVYFPRLAVPLANVLTNLLAFSVQAGVFTLALGYYLWIAPRLFPEMPLHVHPNWRILIVPLMLAQTAMLGLGIGCIIAALTTRYRDLALGVGFGLQLWMYASSIIFPVSRISPDMRWLFFLNPMVPIVEGFRFALLGSGLVEKWQLFMSFGLCAGVLVAGVMMFNRVEQTVMDTV